MASTVFRGGKILTLDPRLPETSAVAVADGRIVALGDDALERGGSVTEVIEIGKGCLLPGFRDGHAHPLHGGLELVGLSLSDATDTQDVLRRVRDHAAAHPRAEWIHGLGFNPAFLPGGIGRADVLDAAVSDRPVVLEAMDRHTMWLNPEALTQAAIGERTPDPALGTIVREPDGRPVGTLVEFGALELVKRVLPQPDEATKTTALEAALQELARSGIAWAQEASASVEELDLYVEAGRRGSAVPRIDVALTADPERWREQFGEFVDHRDALNAHPVPRDAVTAATVKFFADGVIEQGTGYLLEPYSDEPGSYGLPNWDTAELADAIAAFGAAGFRTHIHAIGDGAVRMSLDAIEQAGLGRDSRPVLAHTQLVHPDDLPRFAELGAIANFEPLWAQLDPVMEELTIPRLGPVRSALQYPIATLARLGAAISFGSDWPVSSVVPLEGIAVAVTRCTTKGTPSGGWLPEERIGLEDAIAAYTSGVAFQTFEESSTGKIAVGYDADLVLLDTDVTAIEPAELTGVEVMGTWVRGREAFRG